MRRITNRAILAAVITTGSAWAATAADSKAAKIEKLVQAYYDTGRFRGSVLVTENGKVIFKKGFGMADAEWNIPNAPDTKFRLGSITKQFTATLILQLAEQGKVKVSGKIGDYLRDYPRKNGDRITIHHLLSHQSGIPNYTTPDFFEKNSRDHYSPVELARTFWDKDLEFEPGSRFHYSNSGYHVLGMIIEHVTGKPYEMVLKEQILSPLGMSDTGYDHPDEILPKRASGYSKTLDGLQNASYLDMSIPYSAGALYSTVEDLYKWDQALYTNRVLSAKSREMLFRPNVKMDASPGSTEAYQYAYGWVTGAWTIPGSGKTVRIIGHGGGINGFNTDITRLVDDRHLIVMLCNQNGLNWQSAEKVIAAILYGQQPEYPKRPIAEVFSRTLKDRGIEAAIREYRELKAQAADRYDFGEPVMNQLGYQLLGAKKIREAIEVFTLNVESYPKSASAYDSLGEAFRQAGDNEASIRSYRKALELNPSHESAAKALRELEKK